MFALDLECPFLVAIQIGFELIEEFAIYFNLDTQDFRTPFADRLGQGIAVLFHPLQTRNDALEGPVEVAELLKKSQLHGCLVLSFGIGASAGYSVCVASLRESRSISSLLFIA